MTEADVDALLSRTSRRLKLQRALRAALAALGAGLLLAAAVILWSRLKNYDLLLAAGLALPPLLAVIALFAAYLRAHPPLDQVALLLDRRSGSAEHLVTWWEYRARPERATTETQREFLAAQREAMLTRAAQIDPRILVPVKLPEWSRIVLLAFLLLCCAWLTPAPEASDANRTAEERHNRHGVNGGQSGASGDAAAANLDELPSIETLSQADQQRLQLLASDPMLSESRKADAFKDIQAKLAGIPESQLTPLDRQLLSQLRPEGMKNSKNDSTADSSTTSAGKNDPNEDSHAAPVGSASIPKDPAKAFTAMRTQLPAELQTRLDSYYRHAQTDSDKESAANR